ncbi:hypothetical protein [Streptomyces purpureus]|uniref:hypothetical protein n=1 Tax=Streptomyces purpureus TaxID=1951 RepID=UPI000374B306|nr:hypothetical protein [Streptomyces purpureus]
MTEHLGPLELVGDRWVIGDPKREGGSCLVLTAGGMEHHKSGVPEPQLVIPWSRFMDMRVNATTRAWLATRTMGVLQAVSGTSPQVGGRSACSVSGLLRHPYEYWSLNYTHHQRPYTQPHIFWVGHLFRKTVEAKAARRLGDPEWLGNAVAKLATARPVYGLSSNQRASEVIEALGL